MQREEERAESEAEEGKYGLPDGYIPNKEQKRRAEEHLDVKYNDDRPVIQYNCNNNEYLISRKSIYLLLKLP